MDKFVFSVSELNTYVSEKLYQDPFLEEIWISGEIGDLSIKHDIAWFVLSDGQASVDCVVFDVSANPAAELIAEGQAVLIKGDISLYRKNGRFRIAVKQVQLTGLGELYANLNRLRERLEKQGVFAQEHKLPIPAYPQKVGVVTSREGAAIQDIIHIVRRRNPMVKLVLFPAKVQGVDAPYEIAAGIRKMNEQQAADVLIVGRGGGGAEDLFAFNDERVVMEIYNSKIPVISAVGHESDYTLADMAADLRAPTPSAAAELAVPLVGDLAENIHSFKTSMSTSVYHLLARRAAQLWESAAGLSANAMRLRLEHATEQISAYRYQMKSNMNLILNHLQLVYGKRVAVLQSLDPEETFARGFSVTSKDNMVVKSANVLENGDQIEIAFLDGKVRATVNHRM